MLHQKGEVVEAYRQVAGAAFHQLAEAVEASCHLQLADLPRRRSAWLGTNC